MTRHLLGQNVKLRSFSVWRSSICAICFAVVVLVGSISAREANRLNKLIHNAGKVE